MRGRLWEGKRARCRSARNKAEAKPWKLLLWTAVAGLIFGLIGFGEIAEDWLRVARNSLHWHKASGDIVLVKIDDQSLRKIGRWPWPRRYHARLIDQLTRAGAKRIFFDISFFGPTNDADDRAFADALAALRAEVILAARTRSGPDRRTAGRSSPLPEFAQRMRSSAHQRGTTIIRMRSGDCPTR